MLKLVYKGLFFLFIVPILLIRIGVVSAKATNSTHFKDPLREVSIIVTPEGYYPDKIAVFEGEKVRFFVTSTTEDPHCFVIDKHKVFLGAKKGKMSEGETIFHTPGKFKFYCPSYQSQGYLTVLSKGRKTVINIKEKQKKMRIRDVAGKVDPALWTPKNY